MRSALGNPGVRPDLGEFDDTPLRRAAG